MEIYVLENGDTILRTMLTYPEYGKLKASIVATREYYDVTGIVVHELPNGNVLTEEGKNYYVYKNAEQFDLVYQDLEKKSHILYNKNPYRNDFPRHTNMLIEQLLLELSIDTTMKVNQKLLRIIDKKIRHKNFAHLYNDFVTRYFIHIIALVGESVIRYCDAVWLMEPTRYEDIWMPYINKRNRRHDLTSNLYHDTIRTQDEMSPLNKAYEYALYDLL